MSYLGQVELKSSEIRRIDVTGSTSATHTLTWTPPSEQSLIITINGIKQQNNYSIAGTTLTLDDALLSADKMEVIGILDIGEAVTQPDDSISTAKIQDDAVTADKLANSINTEIAANTAKVTNATHTGDVTGATALTIAADAVDIAMLSATGTADATTFLRGDNSWAATSSPALSHVSQWCLTGEISGDAAPISTNLAEVDRDGYARVGSAMTESSGAFTFPATGIWRIDAQFAIQIISNGSFRFGRCAIYVTTNDTDWDQAANATGSGTDSSSFDECGAQVSITHIFDVTSTSTHKVRFHISQDPASTYLLGNASYTHTNFIFSKIGDT